MVRLGIGLGLAVGLFDFRTIEPLDYRHTISKSDEAGHAQVSS